MSIHLSFLLDITIRKDNFLRIFIRGTFKLSISRTSKFSNQPISLFNPIWLILLIKMGFYFVFGVAVFWLSSVEKSSLDNELFFLLIWIVFKFCIKTIYSKVLLAYAKLTCWYLGVIPHQRGSLVENDAQPNKNVHKYIILPN